MAVWGGGDRRPPDGSSTRIILSTSGKLERRLAEALEASEYVQSLEAELATAALGSLPAENVPVEPGGLLPGQTEDLRAEAAFEEAAVMAAYLALRGEIAGRLEALQRAEDTSLPGDRADPTGERATEAFRERIAESINVLRRHRARLEELRSSIASWRASTTE